MRMIEICQNANENGMIDDPRVTFSSLVEFECGFKNKFSDEEWYKKVDKKGKFPECCGNCIHYSVQKL